jgi:hypothetical protein
VDQSLAVGVVKCVAALEDDLHDVVHGEERIGRAVFFKGVSMHVVHDDVVHVTLGSGVEDRNDMGVAQFSRQAGLVHEHLFITDTIYRIVEDVLMGYFDRHLASGKRIFRQVDRTGSAAANQLPYLELPYGGTSEVVDFSSPAAETSIIMGNPRRFRRLTGFPNMKDRLSDNVWP